MGKPKRLWYTILVHEPDSMKDSDWKTLVDEGIGWMVKPTLKSAERTCQRLANRFGVRFLYMNRKSGTKTYYCDPIESESFLERL